MSPVLGRREPGPQDAELRFALFAGAREADWRALGDGLMRTQLVARDRGYAEQYPGLVERILLADGEPIGLMATAEADGALVLVDLGLVPAARGTGIGTRLIEELQAQARERDMPVRLSALAGGPAERLYARLGFVVEDEAPPYRRLRWTPR